MKKTNAMRILEGLKIPYEAKEYEDDVDHVLEKGAAGRMAEKLGVSPEMVFKTIVMRTESREICVFCQSAVNEINLKKARQAAGCKEINPVKPEELLALTGYIRGGCTPIGMKKQFRTFIDESIMSQDKVCVSAGQRGMQITLAPADLIRACKGQVCDLKL
ncbi:ybaK/ebsC protein [Treponema sp. JC4]|uniref:Cys-tRNA(Pro) deacylase n=1 Tax=Treponema sp. JC4 TaxID=1124982 RepID=UPI00025B0740|nr:Cys-tRNA(Pro) deacylase [Treponema sp. JC4]EID84926.1 ybaK/ebsC protein [Treponema sp. JC4]